jgi:hypothetical protein
VRPNRYQIVVQGILTESWSAYLDGMTVLPEPTGMTRIIGVQPDQSALYGLLNKIRDVNLRLVSVQLLDDDGKTPVECRRCTRNRPENTPFGRL